MLKLDVSLQHGHVVEEHRTLQTKTRIKGSFPPIRKHGRIDSQNTFNF